MKHFRVEICGDLEVVGVARGRFFPRALLNSGEFGYQDPSQPCPWRWRSTCLPRLGLWAFIALVLGMPRLAEAQQTDRIVPQSGSPISGDITATSKDSVTIDVDGQPREIAANEIRYVMFAGEPSSLRQIRDAANKGNIERAERYLETLSRDKIDPQFGAADLQFYEALVASQKAIATGKGLTDAARAMRTFVSSHRDSFHFYRAAEALGDIAVAMQRPDDAAKFYAALEKSPWEDVQLRGTVRMADALRAAGGDNIGEALKRYAALVSTEVASDEGKRQKTRAQIGQAYCQAELGDATTAIPAMETLIAATPNSDHELLASAYNALGMCYQAANRPKDALLAFLRVDMLFPEQGPARAEALYHIQQLWEKLEQPDRAAEARQVLETDFAGSLWTTRLHDPH